VNVIDLHENRDEALIVVLFYLPDSPISGSDNPITDSSLRVTEEYKKKDKDTEKRDK